jgi:ketosteroid isomerase-like protein
MKQFILLITTICLFICQSCNNPGNSDKVDQKTIDEVTELLTQYSINWANALKDKDASKITDYFAPDFMYQEPTGERIYRDEYIRGIYENPNTLKSFDLKDVEVKLYGSDLANVTGGGSNIWIDSNGNEQTSESRFTNVWKKNSGKWQCIIGHGNPLQYGVVKSDAETANELLQVWKDYTEAGKNKDIDKVMSYHTQDYINYPSYGSTQNGFEETRAFLKDLLETNSFGETKIQQVEVLVHGDIAFEVALMEQNFTPLGKNPVKSYQRCLSVFKKQDDGNWKFYRWMGQQ